MLVAIVVVTAVDVHDATENRRTFGTSLVFQLKTNYVTTFKFPFALSLSITRGTIIHIISSFVNGIHGLLLFLCVGAIFAQPNDVQDVGQVYFDGIVNGSCARRIFAYLSCGVITLLYRVCAL